MSEIIGITMGDPAASALKSARQGAGGHVARRPRPHPHLWQPRHA